MKKINSDRKTLFRLSLKHELMVILAFAISALFVIGILAIANAINEAFVSQHYFAFLATAIAVLFLLGWGLSLAFTKIYVTKIDYLRSVLDNVAKGDYSDAPEPTHTNILLRNTIKDFNKMVAKLKETTILQSDFASNFSHEFKTPIVSIKGYAEVLKTNKNLSESDRDKYLSIIIDESERLTNLASSTLLLSKLDSVKQLSNVVQINVLRQIEDCVILLDHQLQSKNIDVEIDVAPFKALSNPDMLKEVWINLLNNAVKYGRQNGKIKIYSVKKKDGYDVVFEDDGIGIKEDALSHVFDRYYQDDSTHYKKGSGLGLAIVKKIVELSGGTVSVDSVQNQGAAFTVFLPKTGRTN